MPPCGRIGIWRRDKHFIQRVPAASRSAAGSVARLADHYLRWKRARTWRPAVRLLPGTQLLLSDRLDRTGRSPGDHALERIVADSEAERGTGAMDRTQDRAW